MKIKFVAPLSFDGVSKSCIKYQKAKGGVLRCAEFQRGLKHPRCPGVGLKGGGRSQNYIRGGKKKCSKRGGKR